MFKVSNIKELFERKKLFLVYKVHRKMKQLRKGEGELTLKWYATIKSNMLEQCCTMVLLNTVPPLC